LSPPLPRRFLQLPFTPRLWSAAAGLRSARVMLSLWLLSTVLCVAIGLQAATVLRGWLREASAEWRSHPAVVIADGKLRVEGGGLIRVERDAFLILIDPEERIPLGEVVAPEYIVARESIILLKRAGQDLEVVPLENLGALLGERPLIIDSARIDDLLDQNGLLLHLIMVGILVLFRPPLEVLSCILSAVIGGAAAHAVEGVRRGVSFLAAFRVALAVTSTTLTAGLVLELLGLRIGGLAERLLWLLWVTVLTAWRIKLDHAAPEPDA